MSLRQCGKTQLVVIENAGTDDSYKVFDSEPHFCGKPINMESSPGDLTADAARNYRFELKNIENVENDEFVFIYTSGEL